jgi:hypothetical protein
MKFYSCLYEIGNEINYGFCGISEANLTKEENISMTSSLGRRTSHSLREPVISVQSCIASNSIGTSCFCVNKMIKKEE